MTRLMRRLMSRRSLLPAAFLSSYFLFSVTYVTPAIEPEAGHHGDDDVTVMTRATRGFWKLLLAGRRKRKSSGCTPLGFSRWPLPLTALASYPGSGNTWTRHLIQQATGILTGSVYRDRTLRQRGFPGEGTNNQSCVVIKTHSFNRHHVRSFEKVVLISRDPGAAILAEFNRRIAGHLGRAGEDSFIYGKEWSTFIQHESRIWMDFYEEWLQFPGPLYLLRYEDLQADLPTSLLDVIHFLGFKVSSKTMECIRINAEGLYHRENSSFTQRNEYFTDDMFLSMRQLQVRFEELVTKLKSTPQWWKSQKYY